MPIAWEKIEPLLMQVSKPARYVGGEFNQAIKPSARARCCLAFPDVYEIGISYHGYRILYERINRHESWAAERAYAPWPDFEALLRREQIPLYSLETRRGLGEFDWIGFTLQHETNFTNVLNMIDLAGLALESKERTDPYPLLIGGGEGAYSPEPLSSFLDAFAIGDGEELVLELMAMMERSKGEAWDRPRLLWELSRIPGIYVPSFYEVDYHQDGRIRQIRPIQPDGEQAPVPTTVPAVIAKRHYAVAEDPGAVKPVIPLIRSVHDRLVIEIRRGCANGCRFCQAGMISRPVNERPLEQILEIARQGIQATGYDEISLLSLSAADHTQIRPLVESLAAEFGPQGISISLPSLRINGFDIALVDQLAKVRKSGITLAPEAGTARLRNAIHKPVDQDYFFRMIEDVFRRGWRSVKFYFMIGLPGETNEDLDGIVEICGRAAELGWKYHHRRAGIHVTLSPFVPKSHTPFQWEAQLPRAELEARYQYVRQAVWRRAGKAVDIKSADPGLSFIEAALARGDRRMAAAIRRAWQLGERFDGWAEYFSLDKWLQAFAEVGLDPTFYANRERAEDEILPFDHISSNVSRRFLLADRHRAWKEAAGKKEQKTERTEGTENKYQESEVRSQESEVGQASRLSIPCENAEHFHAPHATPLPIQRIRVTFSRLGSLRYLSHLDFAKVIGMILRRAGLPLAYTQGFNSQPRVQYAPPLSLGMGGERELIEMMLIRHLPPELLLNALNGIELSDLRFLKAEEIPLKADSLEMRIKASCYRVEFINEARQLTAEMLSERIAAWMEQPEAFVQVQRKTGARRVDLKQSILAMELDAHPGEGWVRPFALKLEIVHEAGHFVKPQEAAGFLLGRPIEFGRDAHITRTGFHFYE